MDCGLIPKVEVPDTETVVEEPHTDQTHISKAVVQSKEQEHKANPEHTDKQSSTAKLILKDRVLRKAQFDLEKLEEQVQMKKAEVESLQAEVLGLNGSDWFEKLKVGMFDQLLTERGVEEFEKFLQFIKAYEPPDQVTADAYVHVADLVDGMLEALQAIK